MKFAIRHAIGTTTHYSKTITEGMRFYVQVNPTSRIIEL